MSLHAEDARLSWDGFQEVWTVRLKSSLSKLCLLLPDSEAQTDRSCSAWSIWQLGY